MKLNEVNDVIKRAMSSQKWKDELDKFPKELRQKVELAMAHALGTGLHFALNEEDRIQ